MDKKSIEDKQTSTFEEHAQNRIEKGIAMINKGVLTIHSGRLMLGQKLPKEITITFPEHPSIAKVDINIK